MDELTKAIRALEAKLADVNAWLARKRKEAGDGGGHAVDQREPDRTEQDEAEEMRELIRSARGEANRKRRA